MSRTEKEQILAEIRSMLQDFVIGLQMIIKDLQEDDEPVVIVGERDLAHGVCMQGAARSKTLGTTDFETGVGIICGALEITGATCIRAGGKDMRGSWFEGAGTGVEMFKDVPGIKYSNQGSDINHKKAYVEAAKRCGIPYWETLHTFMSPAQLHRNMVWLVESGVEVLGLSVANEPYAPDEDYDGASGEDLMETEVRRFPAMIAIIREYFPDTPIGVPVLIGLGQPSREKRANAYNLLVNDVVNFSDPNTVLDIHPYCPLSEYRKRFPEQGPADYLDMFMADVDAIYGADRARVVTEWARKNQRDHPANERNEVIQAYLERFRNDPRVIAAFYQTLPGDSNRGLYDFQAESLTVQGEYFKTA